MSTGFVERFKGKIKAYLIYLGAGGIVDGASGNTIISGINLNVGNIVFSGALQNASITNGITASTTHTVAGAAPLTTRLNFISTVANADDAVKLPPASASSIGNEVIAFNQGASVCSIFPGETTTAIDQGTTGASVVLTNTHAGVFIQNTASTWSSYAAAKSA
jgi:hypothetical protein